MKIYGVIRTALYCALTVLVIVFAPALAQIEVLRYFIGGVMIFYGVEEVILTLFKSKKHYEIRTLYWNIVEVIIGLTLIVFVETGDIEVTYAVVCVGWAIWAILRETHELCEASIELKENKLIACKIVAILNLVESLALIALSLAMLIEPGAHHARIHLYFLSVELFTKVLFPIVNDIAKRLSERKKGAVEPQAGEPLPEETPQAEPAPEEVAQVEPAPEASAPAEAQEAPPEETK